MSTGRRAYDILRGWVGTEWDRIRELERGAAQDELNEAIESPAPMRKSAGSAGTAPVEAPSEDMRVHARRLLGVAEAASFDEIRKAFDKLNKRSDPARYPEGSAEREQAAEIQKRIHWAYRILTDGVDSIEKRFRTLELE